MPEQRVADMPAPSFLGMAGLLGTGKESPLPGLWTQAWIHKTHNKKLRHGCFFVYLKPVCPRIGQNHP